MEWRERPENAFAAERSRPAQKYHTCVLRVLRRTYREFVRDLYLDRRTSSVTLDGTLPDQQIACSVLAGGKQMSSERRQVPRHNMRTPLRFRAINLASDKSEHFTEAINISRGGFFFASSAPLQVGMPLDCTLRMPPEVTGSKLQETRCTARVVHVRNEPYGDGRIGFGAEIEKYHTP
jgi:hypothetical protein